MKKNLSRFYVAIIFIIFIYAARLVVPWALAAISTRDLWVKYAGMTGGFYIGDTISFDGIVENKNTGGQSPSFFARLRIDNGFDGSWDQTFPIKEIKSLAPGERVAISWPDAWSATTGLHIIELCVDFENMIVESNESNNCLKATRIITADNGPHPKGQPGLIDITFIGDRYSDINTFHQDIEIAKSYLLSRQPFNEFSSKIAFHYVDHLGDFGCQPKSSGGETGANCYTPLVETAVNQAGVPFDKIVVIANGFGWACSNGTIAVYSNYQINSGEKVFVHELAHAFGLADEYVSQSQDGPVENVCYNNCCMSSACTDWQGVAGAACIQGCTYPNWYRSSEQSTMTSSSVEYFNAVSINFLRKNLQTYAETIPSVVTISRVKNGDVVGNDMVTLGVEIQTFAVVKRVEFYIDGKIFKLLSVNPRAGNISFDENWNPIVLSPGSTHSIMAKVYDSSDNIGVSTPVIVKISNIVGQNTTPSPSISYLPSPFPSVISSPILPLPLPSPSPTIFFITPTITPTATPIIKTNTQAVIKINNGDLIRVIGQSKVYVVNGRYVRWIQSPEIMNMYGHFQWENIKEISLTQLAQYAVSSLVIKKGDFRVWEVDDSHSKRHLSLTPSEFESRGYKWDSIFIVNDKEFNWFKQ